MLLKTLFIGGLAVVFLFIIGAMLKVSSDAEAEMDRSDREYRDKVYRERGDE